MIRRGEVRSGWGRGNGIPTPRDLSVPHVRPVRGLSWEIFQLTPHIETFREKPVYANAVQVTWL